MDIVERLRTRKATWHEAILAMELGADEIERLREALEYYVCDAYGQCREIKLKDGSCIHAGTGRCGKIAQDALLGVGEQGEQK